MTISKKHSDMKNAHNIVKWEKKMTKFYVWYDSGKICTRKKDF